MSREAEKKRLIELLNVDMSGCNGDYAEEMADYLLENGVIVPTCKVGDKVFFVNEMCDENCNEYLGISEGECVSLSMQKEGLWIYCRYTDGLTYWHKVDDEFEKEVFFSKAEAEYALKNRRSVSLVNGHIEE
jgi:hypothetical protein